MIGSIDEYKQYLMNAGLHLHHRATCRQYEYEIYDSYVSTIYKGRFGEGIKLVYSPFVGARYLTVEYWVEE